MPTIKKFREFLPFLALVTVCSFSYVAHAEVDESKKTSDGVQLPEAPQFRKISLKNAPWSQDTEKSLRTILDLFVSHPMTQRFLDDQIVGDLRDGLDRDVTRKLQALPNYNLLRAEAEKYLGAIIENATTAYAASFATGSKLQYSEIVDMVDRVSKKLDFAPSVRRDAVVYISNTPEMNAFTFSTGKMIRFVILQGLIQSFHTVAERLVQDSALNLSKEEVAQKAIEAVVGHELGHIRGDHILNHMILVSVLRASLESQIGNAEGEEAESVEKLRAEIKGLFTFHLGESFHHSFTHSESGYKKIAATFGEQLFETTAELSSLVLDGVAPETLSETVDSFFPKRTSNSKQMVAAVQQKIEQVKAFLQKYGRSCEVTSDRLGQISTSTEAAEFADMLLVGATSREAALKEAEALSIKATLNPALMQQVLLDGTHPRPIYRIIQYRAFEDDPFYKIYKTPYLKALHLYFAVAKYLEDGLQRAQDNDTLELPEKVMVASTIEKYRVLEAMLSGLIVDGLWQDVVDYVNGQNARGLETIEETAKYLGYREIRQRFVKRSPLNTGIASRTGFAYGLFGQLEAKIGELAKAMTFDLKKQEMEASEPLSPEQKKANAEMVKAQLQEVLEILGPVLEYAPSSRVSQARSMLRQKAEAAQNKGETVSFSLVKKGTGSTPTPINDSNCKVILGED